MLSIFREGPLLRLDFQYSPARVRTVKALAGARYSGEDKSWRVPLTQLQEVLQLPEFPAKRVLNSLAGSDALPLVPQEAFEALRRDPFSVSEEAISSLPLDLVVRLNAEKRRLRLLPRLGSQAHRTIRRFKGAMFSSSDGAYTVQPDRLAALLKKLRDAGSLFAVDELAGAALAGSAALRRAVLEAGESVGAEDLSAALLTPFVTEIPGDGGAFRPCFFTAEQFKASFPAASRRAGSSPFVLDTRGLLELSARRATLPFRVWFTRGAVSAVEQARGALAAEADQRRGPLDDVAAQVIDVPLVFRTTDSGRGALAIGLEPENPVRKELVSLLSAVCGATYASGAPTVVAEVPDSKLPQVVAEVGILCEVHALPPVPQSSSFAALLKDTQERSRLRERAAWFSSLEDVSAGETRGLSAEEARKLFPHQRTALSWLLETPRAFLGDDMGLGKTLSVLSYFVALQRLEGYELLLVVCPNSLVRNWLREASMWYPHLKPAALSGDKGAKAWTLRLLNSSAAQHDVVVVNYEAVRLPYVTPELRRLASERRTLLALDESQRVKNHAAKTFKAIRDISPACSRRVLLSGTPTPKDVSDLWAQVQILDDGERFGRSFYRWLGRVAELGTEFSDFAVKRWNDGEVSEAILRSQEIMLRRRKERVVDLPPKIFSLREVALTGSQKERYDEVREALTLRMRSLSGEQFVREITNILEEYLRAVQISSNPRLVDPEWRGEPAKFLELDEIIEELVRQQGQKVVVWTNYLGNVRELCERYRELGAAPFSGEVAAPDREATVRAFQEGPEPRILIAVPAAGGVGITLTAAQTAVYLDKTWNAEHWMQSVDRIHRIGQRGTVNVISLLGSKVDEIVHWNLRRKERTQAEVLGDFRVTPEEPASASAGITREELLRALEP